MHDYGPLGEFAGRKAFFGNQNLTLEVGKFIRKIIVFEFITLDGVMEDPGGAENTVLFGEKYEQGNF